MHTQLRYTHAWECRAHVDSFWIREQMRNTYWTILTLTGSCNNVMLYIRPSLHIRSRGFLVRCLLSLAKAGPKVMAMSRRIHTTGNCTINHTIAIEITIGRAITVCENHLIIHSDNHFEDSFLLLSETQLLIHVQRAPCNQYYGQHAEHELKTHPSLLWLGKRKKRKQTTPKACRTKMVTTRVRLDFRIEALQCTTGLHPIVGIGSQQPLTWTGKFKWYS